MERGEGGSHRREVAALAAVLATAVAIHARDLPRPFFADDYLFLEQVRGHSFFPALASADPLGNFFRPVGRALWFWTIGHLGNESPAVFHAAGLAVFLIALLLFHGLVRRFAGTAGALLATAFVAFHHAADVPLGWASGSQDLLAIVFALLAIRLHLSRWAWTAPIALLLALLSKEVVVGTALVAIAADVALGRPWKLALKRGTGLLGVTAAWGIAWASSLGVRPEAARAIGSASSGIAAVFVHAGQALAGAEWRLGGGPLGHWSVRALWPAAIAAVAMILGATGAGRGRKSGPDPRAVADEGARTRVRPGVAVALVWVATACVPLIPVMPIWSAYFYLWAVFGAGLFLAMLTTRWGTPARAGLLALLVLLSAQVRRLDEFAAGGGAWAWQSHVNRHYLSRSLETTERFLRQFRAARPRLEPRTTVFFGNVPVASAWQAADGPLLRWAYRDTSLRSYFLTQYSAERAARGPVLFFAVIGDSLEDRTDDPALLPSFAYSMILADRLPPARDALDGVIERLPGSLAAHYWRALVRMALDDPTGAVSDLRAAGFEPGPDPALAESRGATAIADTTRRIAQLESWRSRSALDPGIHAELAPLLLASGRTPEGAWEAFAYKVLAPEAPEAWRTWSAAQLAEGQFAPALGSLERYFALGGTEAAADEQAHRVAETLRRMTRGDLAQQGLRSRGSSPPGDARDSPARPR